MKHVFVAFFTLFLASGIFAQVDEDKKATVDLKLIGVIQDEAENAVPYANVGLYRAPDSVLIGGATSAEDGSFEIELKAGIYYLKITFLSFEDHYVPSFEINNEDLDLGTIIMRQGDLFLDEVAIEGEVMQMELKLDKRVFNVGKDLNNRGRNAADILDNIPSVQVDVDGSVSLRGSGNVRILVDGKPSAIVGTSTADALRQFQGEMIEKIEIITNPSARYDAEGEVGIINIVLKKDKRKGLNGVFEAHTGWPHNHGGSYTLNYKTKKINLFSSLGAGYSESPGSAGSFQNFFYPDTVFSYETVRAMSRNGIAGNFRLGGDWFINDFNTLTFAGFYSFSKGINDALVTYKDFDSNESLSQTVTRTEAELQIRHNFEASLNYRKTFKEKDREFTADLQWINSDDIELADLFETSDQAEVSKISQVAGTKEKQQSWLIQADYIHPFSENGKFEAGIKSTLRIIDNDYSVLQQATTENWEIIPRLDNQMVYTEAIAAAYLMAGNKTGRFSYQGGLRIEYSELTTNLLKTNEVNRRKFLNFFPSLHFSYELKKQNFLQFSYSRRIKRPEFWHLLPFFNFSDSRNYFSGNPNLNPELTDALETGYMKRWSKGSLLSSIYYRYTQGVVERLLFTDSLGLTRGFPVNLGAEHSVGLELTGSYEPLPWWSLNASLNFFRNVTDGAYEDIILHADTYGWSANFSTKMKFWKKLSIQPSFRYRSPNQTTQGKSLFMYMLDLGASVDVLKGNGTITLSGKDLFNSRKRRNVTFGENFNSTGHFQWRARQILLSFSYRLNQKPKKGDSRGGYGDGMDSEM